MQEIAGSRPTRKQASGTRYNGASDPDGSEVQGGECNGGQGVSAVQVNLSPLILIDTLVAVAI